MSAMKYLRKCWHRLVDERTADADACRLEHAISDESFAALKVSMAQHGIAVWPQRERVR